MRADSTRGSAAIEFGMVAPIFFALLLGIMQAGIIFFAQFTLQNAVQDAGRLVRTGQAVSYTSSQFASAICNEVSLLLTGCSSKLQVDVESFSGYSAVNYQSPLNANGTLNTALNGYNPGTACSVVLVRAFYTWPVFAPGLVYFLTNMTDGSGNKAHLLSAATAFRNEPFSTSTGGC
jgi:Flp pilus assembly protein TadG